MNEICRRVREELALPDHAPNDESIRVHVASCDECTRFLSALTRLESEIGSLETKDAPDAVVAKLLARPELRTARASHRWTWMAALGTAASVLFVLWVSRGTVMYKAAPDGAFDVPGTGGGVVGGGRAQEEFEQRQGSLGGKENQDAEAPAASYLREDGAKSRDEVKNEADKLQRLDEPKKTDGKDADAFSERARGEFGLLDQNAPLKRANRDPVYPEAAKNAGVQGTVVLELTLDREGNVSRIRVIESVPLLDAAAIEAAREWKYAPVESDAPRVIRVPVTFTLPSPDDAPALSLLEERSRVEGLPFRQAAGYWANTYVPGDPRLRRLEARLRNSGLQLHRSAQPAPLAVDPSSNAALSLFVRADRRGMEEKSRLLVQVGIRASDGHARRRPPLNLGVVLHVPQSLDADAARGARALLLSLESAREQGDRFRLILAGPGGGEVLSPETFRHGPLSVALDDAQTATGPSLSVTDAMALAFERVHAGDDPTMPLGTSLILMVTSQSLGGELETVVRMGQASAVGGVATSVIGIGAGAVEEELEKLALSGQGRRYALDRTEDAQSLIDRELTAGSRTVARAVRLRIRLAEGVRLVDVLGSERLGERETERVRAEERSIDLRLARNLGIEADRGEDEDGIQIVIPAFYAGDAHSILLDVVAEGAGPIADVTARYKDLVQLENTVARASLALPRSGEPAGRLEASVFADYLEYRVSLGLRAAAEALERGDMLGVSSALQETRRIARASSDLALLDGYLEWLPRIASNPHELGSFRDSLLYASALKFTHRAS